jgi:outer membrane protein OmpA-like peptidoglycan-associated protein
MNVKSILCGAVAAAALGTGARAVEANLSNFKPASGADGIIATEGARPWESATPFDVKLWVDWAHRPVARPSPPVSDGGMLIENRTGAWFTADMHVLEPLSLAFAVPYTIHEHGTFSLQPFAGQAIADGSGLGDIRITPRLGLLRQEISGLDLAVQATIELPSSDRKLLTTWGEPVAEGLIAIGHRFGSRGGAGFNLLANLYGFAAPNRTVLGQNIGAGFGGRLGGAYEIGKGQKLPSRIFAEVEAKSMPRTSATQGPTPAEWRGGVSWCFGPGFTFDLAAGTGFNDAPGAPSARVVGALGFGSNACSAEASVAQAVKTLAAARAAADKAAADKAAVDAKAAAEKAAADKAAADKAAEEKAAADRIAAEKAAADAAIAEAFNAEAAKKDSDGDGVPDVEDNCPNEPGPASNHGCPEWNKQLVAVTAKSIEVLGKVDFATGRAVITPKSFKLLDQVAAVLKAHPELAKIEVQVHSDAQGDAQRNTVLSQARAEAVAKYLIGKGVEAARLSAKGYGPSMPIADNSTQEGRAKNRRVEFKVVK